MKRCHPDMNEWQELEEAANQFKEAMADILLSTQELEEVLQKLAEIAWIAGKETKPSKKKRKEPRQITARYIRDIRARANRKGKSKWEIKRKSSGRMPHGTL